MPPEGRRKREREIFDTDSITREKILVGQQGEEIRLELLSQDVKLLSQSRSDNIITSGKKANKLN